MIDSAKFLENIRERASLRDAQQAERVARVAIELLFECLTPDEAKKIVAVLPASFRGLHGRAHRREGDCESFVAELATREEVPIGFAREHAVVVFHALRSALDEDTREVLERAIPLALTTLLGEDDSPPFRYERPIAPPAPPDHTLARASGRSSRHLSEARPLRRRLAEAVGHLFRGR